MIVGACGFGSTGSSVVTDYLKEFDGIQVKDDLEFTYVSGTDGLLYLERAVMHPFNRTADSINAIRRFQEMVANKKSIYVKYGLSPELFEESANNLIDTISMAKWYWYDGDKKSYSPQFLLKKFLRYKLIPRIERKTGHRVDRWPKTEVQLSVKPDNFYIAAKKHVKELLNGMGLDTNRMIALDQPFSGNNPQACFPFYDDPYAIVVDRDPRDNYVFAKTMLHGEYFCPVDVDDYIAYYRCLRRKQPYLQQDPRILRIRFEEMVYEYDATTKKIRDLLHLPDNPRPKSVFDPSLSIANTQVYRRYPQYADDVRKIEKELTEYLFDFSKYKEDPTTKRMFSGKSPLHDSFDKRKWQNNNSH